MKLSRNRRTRRRAIGKIGERATAIFATAHTEPRPRIGGEMKWTAK